jgi:hypothetical protein
MVVTVTSVVVELMIPVAPAVNVIVLVTVPLHYTFNRASKGGKPLLCPWYQKTCPRCYVPARLQYLLYYA